MFLGSVYQRTARPYVNGLLAEEISRFARYYDAVLQLDPRPEDQGRLLPALDCPEKGVVRALADLPASADTARRRIILLNGNLNHHLDVQSLLQNISGKLSRADRVVAVVYNSYLRGLYVLAGKLGVRQGELPTTFLTQRDLEGLAQVSGYAVVRTRSVGFFPFRALGLGSLLNRVFAALPIGRGLGFAQVVVLRPVRPSREAPSLSIVIPARNERGNIENALKRLPNLGAKLEVIFVEGHSRDGTWEEIQRVMPLYSDRFSVRAFRQKGVGKCDAVRVGFAEASHELLTILDADLTMPPEMLGRFYDAYRSGLADFVNGSRLVYPMEGEAMRFLNWLGNVFFAKALSAALDTRLSDSLCGTKLVSRADYARMKRWRTDFGDFDPFGDFELLFPAAVLGLGIVDIPIRYRARSYGATNIHRFRHGLLLLKMTLSGFWRIRLGLG